MNIVPQKPKVPCREPGCPNLCEQGEKYCPEHAPLHPSEFKKPFEGWRHRGGESASKRGYDSKWQKARAAFLEKHPLCLICQTNGKYVKATEVDHIIPHKGDKKLFWDRSNWQALCKNCHVRKTLQELGLRNSPDKLSQYIYPWRDK